MRHSIRTAETPADILRTVQGAIMMELKCPHEEDTAKNEFDRHLKTVDREYCESFCQGAGCIEKDECTVYAKLIKAQ